MTAAKFEGVEPPPPLSEIIRKLPTPSPFFSNCQTPLASKTVVHLKYTSKKTQECELQLGNQYQEYKYYDLMRNYCHFSTETDPFSASWRFPVRSQGRGFGPVPESRSSK